MELKNLTTEFLAKFKGGQLEIQNRSEHYLYRGEVQEAFIEGDALNVKFAWLAKMEEDQWVNEENLDYGLSLWFDRENNRPLCSVQEIDAGRLIIRPAAIFVNEMLVFFPPEGSKLDFHKVKGLKFATE